MLFALIYDEATQNSNVIVGILTVSSIPVYVFIDSGSTHSFKSNACLVKINALCKKSDSILEVSMLSGRTTNTIKVVKGYR